MYTDKYNGGVVSSDMRSIAHFTKIRQPVQRLLNADRHTNKYHDKCLKFLQNWEDKILADICLTVDVNDLSVVNSNLNHMKDLYIIAGYYSQLPVSDYYRNVFFDCCLNRLRPEDGDSVFSERLVPAY
jgi:hypothetical protein